MSLNAVALQTNMIGRQTAVRIITVMMIIIRIRIRIRIIIIIIIIERFPAHDELGTCRISLCACQCLRHSLYRAALEKRHDQVSMQENAWQTLVQSDLDLFNTYYC